MVKIKYIFLLLISLLFLSCESVYLDMSNVHCKIDKSTYQKDENITISYDGSFKDSSDIGSLTIDFHVYRMNGEERGEIQNLNFPNSYTPLIYDEGLYYEIIKENESMTSFIDTIIFSIPDVGKYELLIRINGVTKKHYYSSIEIFTFPITITE